MTRMLTVLLISLMTFSATAHEDVVAEPKPEKEARPQIDLVFVLGFYRRFLVHRWRLLGGVLAIPLVAACDIQITVLIGNALSHLQAREDPEFLRGFFFLLLAIAATQGFFRFLQRWWIVGVSRRVEVELKQDLFDKLTGLSLGFHERSRSGDIVSRLTSDVENLRMLLGPGCMYTLGSLVMVPGSFAVLFSISPKLAFAMIVPLSLAGFAMKSLTPRLHRWSMAVQESLADISHRAQESFSGVRVVKGYGLAALESSEFRGVSEENRDHQIGLGRVRGMTQALVHLSFDLAFLPILVVGGIAMIDRSIEVGDLFKFIDLGFKVFWPMIALGWMAGLYPRALASAERIDELLGEPSEIIEADEPVERRSRAGALSLRRVSYTYPGAPRPALTDVSVEVPAGSTLGVVGPTGSGKTTLLSLIARLYEARGEIRLDDVPIRSLAVADLRDALGFVPQDSFLFSDTYRSNVGFGARGELDDSELERLIAAVDMREEVAAFPDGPDQLIGERGVTLSGGQRQRTCIARAIAKDPRVLVLDDTLSAVDTQTESRLLANLRAVGRERTVVVSAHRLATVREAERILVLREGRVEASGTHDELLLRSDWYRRTWERQRMLDELEEL